MGSLNLMIYQVCVLFILIRFTVSYNMIHIVDYKQCSKLAQQSVQLQTESLSGLILTLESLKDRSWQKEENLVCKFHVKPLYPTMGIFIVIQSIVFRQNGSRCIDYVQYRRGDGSSSKQYCGSLTASLGMDHIFAPDAYATEIAPTVNSFISNFGEVEVTIHISKEPLKAHDEIDLKIVFTLFSQCDSRDYYECGAQYKKYCIYKEFFNDGYVNCPYPDCTDEGGCYKSINETRTSIGNNVVIGSVTSLLIIFLFFICSLWLCRKYKKLCWEENFANSRNTNQTTTIAADNEDNFNNISLPSTTRRDVSLPNINADEDKDLPPSYDSLFPDR